jgi:hypothetical protein
VRASDVIGPDVRGDRINARKGDMSVRGVTVVTSTLISYGLTCSELTFHTP